MKTHKFGVESFQVFDTKRDGNRWTVQFIWGKKDFRIHLQSRGRSASGDDHRPVLKAPDNTEMVVDGLQYLNNYEWYDFGAVTGHGLAHDEVLWRKGKAKRYVELPKDFYEIAVRIACLEFGLTW